MVVFRGDDKLYELAMKVYEAGGIPLVITRYADVPLKYRGKPAVVLHCLGLEGTALIIISENKWKELDRVRHDPNKMLEILGIIT